MNKMKCKYLSVLASVGFAALFLLVQTNAALAATAPNLGSTSTYGVVSSTFTNTAGGSTINGDVCYTTGPAVSPTINGATVVPCPSSTGTDQGNAYANLIGQPCTSLGGGAVNLDNAPGHPTGIYTPGCYSSGGAMAITTGTTVTLSGTGVYIFRPGGALNTAANSNVVAAGGACASDVYWAPNGATTLGANSNFVGNILEGAAAANDITIGSTVNFQGRALAYGHTVTIDTDTITVPTACVPLPPPGGVTLGKVFNPSSINPGLVSVLTITLSNNNAGLATLTKDLTDNLPSGIVIAPTPNASTTCGSGGSGGGVVSATANGTTVSLSTNSTIPGGTPGTCTVTVSVTAAVAGSYINRFNIGDLSVNTGGVIVSNTTGAIATLTVVPSASVVPTLNEWGAIIFMVFAGLGAVYYLRRQKAKT